MATITTLVDDVDGKTKLPANSTSTIVMVTDARGSFHVEIDLSEKNFRPIWDALQIVRDNGREVIEPAPATKNGKDSASDGPVIRAWAQANPDLLPEGVKVPGDRGALSKDVIAAYDAAHAPDDSDMGDRPEGDDSKVSDDV